MAESSMSDLDRWSQFLSEQGFEFEIDEWPESHNRTPRLVIRLADEKRFSGFSGYGVGIAFTPEGQFLELGGWA